MSGSNKTQADSELAPQELVDCLQQQLVKSSLWPIQGIAELEQQLQNPINERHDPFFWLLEELAQAVDGDLIGPLSESSTPFTSVSTDTRTLEPGALYVALVGERFDGHEFIEEAIRQGAAAVLVSQPVETIVPGVLVEDTRLALGVFARWHRRQMPVNTVVGITGSNGKTTCKALLQSIFSNVGLTLATQGNLNNDYGVPRTLLELRPQHQFAVIEMGANHCGEIAYLTQLVEPDVALLTNASGAHLEGFGSLQGVIDTKGELFIGLNRYHGNGWAILNADSVGFEQWQASLSDLGVENYLTFGEQNPADIQVQGFSSNGEQIEFDLSVKGERQTVTMPMLGRHNAVNAAGCTAAALAAGLSWAEIMPGLVNFSGVGGRLQRTRLANGGWLIDDSYNANPQSVRAAIEALSALPGKTALCLGAMAELGDSVTDAHEEIAAYARERGVDRLYVYGEAAQTMPSVFGEMGQWFDDHDALADAVQRALALAQIDHVLVKGSRSAHMEKVVERLTKGEFNQAC
ncbi:UDP-N-acetylmuramoyl-tripeptide--D-alanyl-D-alanine ligase [Thiomicrorhabdus sp. zzn3]|uniref:UDP-N-acetylmuramoyl-tripeptide--D-alanyl-D- alanine ligase n=1 Tax=Thiomicrorhabdus sp. zzn3 TaxID=3039775 RepID=UPI002436A05B|nr:UDP-N-acetylmuramoyl-tripeptide--D-alanyl-D-alanine ligase [Thiomicrorhabdus sp. zzn3]MDG6778506.1 UDP-N-acetylmuramoyl-tripeptide--D-alanyl-D-alanine ligase [Thiomicrorhabdus sp. zzn3]